MYLSVRHYRVSLRACHRHVRTVKASKCSDQVKGYENNKKDNAGLHIYFSLWLGHLNNVLSVCILIQPIQKRLSKRSKFGFNPYRKRRRIMTEARQTTQL